jgi:tripartite-type tricarboxylate transporter receptor subunit TctC
MLRKFAMALALTGVYLSAAAQAWPDRPIRIIVSGAAGTGMDILGRGMAESMSAQLGQPVVIDPRPGANQIVAAEACGKAKPDGYTFCITAPEPFANNLLLFKKLPYDPVNGFIPVAKLVTHSGAILGATSIGGQTLDEIAKISKAKPRTLNWASFGENSISHIYLEAIRGRTGWDVTHVPYKSTVDVKQAMLTGEGQLTYLLIDGAIRDQITSGKLRPLAFAGTRRSPDFPNVPTLNEVGLSDVYIEGWYGLFAPAGTPDAIVARMNRVALKAIENPALTPMLQTLGNGRPDDNTPADFAATVRSTREVVRKVLQANNIQPQ